MPHRAKRDKKLEAASSLAIESSNSKNTHKNIAKAKAENKLSADGKENKNFQKKADCAPLLSLAVNRADSARTADPPGLLTVLEAATSATVWLSAFARLRPLVRPIRTVFGSHASHFPHPA